MQTKRLTKIGENLVETTLIRDELRSLYQEYRKTHGSRFERDVINDFAQYLCDENKAEFVEYYIFNPF